MPWTMAHRTVPKDGERANGDAVVLRSEGERSLVAVIDGLGHGAAAAAAAGKAVAFLAAWPLTDDLAAGMQGLHAALRGSRGVAGSVCVLTEAELVCCGVGNVEIRYFGGKVPILLSPGVLGARVAHFRVCRGEVTPGARLVLFSDGISARAPIDSLRHLDPEGLCEEMMSRYRKPIDDATVVACDLRAQP
jgi:negative regulator of sigma-B (phosphoserine phosphatase)